MSRTDISVDHVARIEGHGNVRVLIEDGRVMDVKMQVVEPARVFESMVKGRRPATSRAASVASARPAM